MWNSCAGEIIRSWQRPPRSSISENQKEIKGFGKAKVSQEAGTSRMPKKNINHQEEIKSYGERLILNMFEVA